jgi:hypothetical protein
VPDRNRVQILGLSVLRPEYAFVICRLLLLLLLTVILCRVVHTLWLFVFGVPPSDSLLLETITLWRYTN